ncbi:MAG TPA: type II toxin-antitoxin system VapC family toxin [Rhodoferax sp.]|nr:type II toxin-antitoxin system VapC family toxin [Rhodoferax sp.]
MNKYMLGTDTCIFITRKSKPALLARIASVPLAQQCISVVTPAEMLYGVQLSANQIANQQAVDLFVQHLEVLHWTPEAAKHYAEIRVDLKRLGHQIGSNDLMIAAHARSLGAVIVTNNVTDFGRVKGLEFEKWME